MHINAARREISFKLVYCGPGLSGKTTNLQVIHAKAPASKRGDLTAIATEGERTLFFDYMPLQLGRVNGLTTKFQLYTVPGQRYYEATRKLVLQGVDGIVFVADSQAGMMAENVDSLESLEKQLASLGLSIETIPLVIQWNKRDMPEALPVEELERKLNRWQAPTLEAVALTGEGVFPTLKKLVELVLRRISKEPKMRVVEPAMPVTKAVVPVVPVDPRPTPVPSAPIVQRVDPVVEEERSSLLVPLLFVAIAAAVAAALYFLRL